MEKVSYLHENLLGRSGVALVGKTGGGKTAMINILKEAMSFEPILHILEDRCLAQTDQICSVTEMTKNEITSSKVNYKRTNNYSQSIFLSFSM